MTHTAHIIDGKSIAASLMDTLAAEVAALSSPPALAVILVGDDPASHVYVGNKIKACAKTGIRSVEHRLPATATEAEIADLISSLNADTDVHGILLQLPLPKGLNSDHSVQLITPEKDVDGLTIANVGKLVAGLDGMVPCTPQGSLLLIQSVVPDLTGKHAVVIGRSLLFGKPMAQLLLAQNCTVTMAHSKTAHLPDSAKPRIFWWQPWGAPEWCRPIGSNLAPSSLMSELIAWMTANCTAMLILLQLQPLPEP